MNPTDNLWMEAQAEAQQALSLMESASHDAEGAATVLNRLDKARKKLDEIAHPPRRLLPPRNLKIRVGRYD